MHVCCGEDDMLLVFMYIELSLILLGKKKLYKIHFY